MVWRILVLPFGLTLTLLLSGLIGFSLFTERENVHFATIQEQQVRLLNLLMQQTFLEIDETIENYQVVYKDAHKKVEAAVKQGPIDLTEWQIRLESELNMKVDIFLVSPELVIFETTFEPDLGLDFRLPIFKDAQATFARLKGTDEIDVSMLTRELVSGDFKLYTASYLPNGGYIQLGFVDPKIAQFYSSAEAQMETFSSIDKVWLFMDVGGDLLSPLTDSFEIEAGTEKSEVAEAIRKALEPEREIFARVGPTTPVVERGDSQAGLVNLFLELGRFDVGEGVEHRILAKVKTNLQTMGWFEENVPILTLVVLLLAIALLLWVLNTMRQRILLPMLDLSEAIKSARPFIFDGSSKIPNELLYIAQSFNSHLERSQETARQLRELASTDPLTGLLNRGELAPSFAELKRVFRRDKLWMGVAFIDLDRFKAYNDIYGHDAGDSALREFAEVMRAVFRRPTDRVLRYGGEEFVVFFGCDSDRHAVELAESARERFESAGIVHKGNPPYGVMTLSCGLVLFDPATDIDLTRVLRLADQQLYSSKSSDRNAVNFEHIS